MVSGYDKQPPKPEYRPDIGWSGRLMLLAIIGVLMLAALGWLLV
jgi:hypothetical protein